MVIALIKSALESSGAPLAQAAVPAACRAWIAPAVTVLLAAARRRCLCRRRNSSRQ